MLLHIRHRTEYTYDQPVDYALQKIRLRPLKSDLQVVHEWAVKVEGGKVEASYVDHYGNDVDLVSVVTGVQNVTIAASGSVTTHDAAGVFGEVYGRAPLWHFAQPTPLTKAGSVVKATVAKVGKSPDLLTFLHDLSGVILTAAPYKTGVTGSTTTAEQALKLGAGVCQDHAQIFIAAARSRGIPARYVSGYLMINEQVDQEATHAWAEAHIDGIGWVGFDVSNGVAPDEKYVRIAIGRDARDAAPVEGLRLGGASESMIVSLQVQQ
jgi:transglutaminase-like putative cysteine protease